MNECTKKCGTYELNTVRRQTCLVKCNITHQKELLAALKKSKADPGKIKKVEAKIAKLEKTLAAYTAHAKKRGAEY